jgi:Cu2+-exporting ATPase
VITAVLVVSCPCAIALAFPLAEELATVALRRRGVFVRESDLWTKLSRVRKLVFDKTGTLTLEAPVLDNPAELRGLEGDARAALFTLVRDNPHPISQCLMENLLSDGGVEVMDGDVKETVGFGVELGDWSLGRTGWRAEKEGEETVFARKGKTLARFRFVDSARSDAREELGEFAKKGFQTFILSGDRQEKVSTLAAELGFDASHAFGQLSPHEKAAWFEAHDNRDTLMLGDGANDSLAFDRAFCRGTPVIHRGVLERKADFYYLGRGIGGLRALFEVNIIRSRTQTAVLIFSVVYNAIAVGLAVAGYMNPLIAAALMPINSLLTLALVTGGMRRAFRS